MKNMEVSENYLERCPLRKEGIVWRKEKNGLVVLEIPNVGWMSWIAKKVFRKPMVSYVHLEEIGSLIWQQMDGKKDILAIGTLVSERFGEMVEPLYERMTQYVQMLERCNFIEWKKEK